MYINICINLFFQSSREQLAIAEFARSLLVIPKTLAVNAAQDATDLVAKLRAHHNSSQTQINLANLKWYNFLNIKHIFLLDERFLIT